MKKIEAFIQPFTLPRVLQALHQIEGLPGLVVIRTGERHG